MELKDQVCSLKLAKRLKELGVKQEGHFYWVRKIGIVGWKILTIDEFYMREGTYEWYAAFTVAELGELLPHVVKKEDKLYYLQCNANGNSLRYMDYTTYDKNGVGTFLRAYPLIEVDTEADARAKMLIYLIENKLIKDL